MKRSERLTPIIELAAKETEKALLKVGEANAVWSQHQQQLEDLQGYKNEYLQRLRTGEQAKMSAQKVMELRAFLVQLDEAIKAQQRQVEYSFTVLQKQQKAWQQVRSKEEAMTSLTKRYKKEERYIESKREQSETDEHSTMLWLRRTK